jgi:acrylyl-CoA reductase (NADPH)
MMRSTTLANLLLMTRYGGAVAACGLAGGMDLPAPVAPLLVRGVSLIGIDTIVCSMRRPRQACRRWVSERDADKLAAITSETDLSTLGEAARRIVAGKGCGRVAVRMLRSE